VSPQERAAKIHKALGTQCAMHCTGEDLDSCACDREVAMIAKEIQAAQTEAMMSCTRRPLCPILPSLAAVGRPVE
jgi:hypothetical protein